MAAALLSFGSVAATASALHHLSSVCAFLVGLCVMARHPRTMGLMEVDRRGSRAS